MIAGASLYTSPVQKEYGKYTQLTITVVQKRCGMFSLTDGEGERLFTPSRVFTDQEIRQLK